MHNLDALDALEAQKRLRRLLADYDNVSVVLESAFRDPAIESIVIRLRPRLLECAELLAVLLKAFEA